MLARTHGGATRARCSYCHARVDTEVDPYKTYGASHEERVIGSIHDGGQERDGPDRHVLAFDSAQVVAYRVDREPGAAEEMVERGEVAAADDAEDAVVRAGGEAGEVGED